MNNSENQAQEKSCYNCAWCEALFNGISDMRTPSGMLCNNQADKFYPDGIPEAKVCDRHSFRAKVSMKEAYPERVEEFTAYLKEHGMDDEAVEMFLREDAGILGYMPGEK